MLERGTPRLNSSTVPTGTAFLSVETDSSLADEAVGNPGNPAA